MSYIGNTSTTQAFTPAIDYFSGNGSTVAFTLSRPVASVAQVQVVVNNVPQNPSSAFTVSGNTITFTGAPSSGTNNIYVEYTSPITQVIAPGQGTVNATAIVDGSITPVKLSSGAPSWSALGGVSLPRIDSSSEGGQLNLNRASDDTSAWSVDVYGSTSTPSLRFVDNVAGAARMQIDGSGRVAMPYQPAFSALNSAGVSATSVIIFDTAIVNVGSSYNTSNGRFTAPIAGNYMFSYYGLANSGATNVDIYKNGTTRVLYSESDESGFHQIVISGVVALAAGDYVNIRCWGGSLYQNYNNFSGFLIG